MDFSNLSDFLYIAFFASSAWIFFALLSALSDAGVGFIDEWLLKELKQKGQHQSIDAPGRLVLISGFFGLVVSICVVFISLITNGQGALFVSWESTGLAVGAGMLEVLWLIPYFYAINRGGAINTTPLFQTIPIFSLLIGLLIFGEIPHWVHIIATVCIVIGGAVLNYSPALRRLDLTTLSLMGIASVLISLGFFVFKDASETGSFIAALLGNGIGMFTLSALIWLVWSPYRKQFNDFISTLNPRLFLIQIANESLYAFSAFCNQAALVLGPSVMAVSAMNSFHPIFTLLIGWSLAKLGSSVHTEQLAGTQMITKSLAILLIALGTLLITF